MLSAVMLCVFHAWCNDPQNNEQLLLLCCVQFMPGIMTLNDTMLTVIMLNVICAQ